ncbi:MAG TPA: S1 RNA-binding domain-containing protein [Spirochaetota bacterium]|nr:S1 RNA-binding domain-containing protein [Spirochaetota bacterium]
MEKNDHIDNEEYNFEEMLEASLNRRDDFEPGESVTGVVVQINQENVFLDISGKSEATIDISEFFDKDGKPTVKKGDRIDAYVVSKRGGETHLTTSIGKGKATPELISMAYKKRVPIHGTVTDVKKGGYSVSISGTRAFCPFSQIDIKAPENPEKLISRSMPFLITEYGEGGKNIILSRRVLLEEEKQKNEDRLRKSLRLNDTVTGPVTSVRDFGVFVDIGGMEALVPKSELSRSRSVDMAQFAPGKNVTAMVKAMDWDSGRITLSVKDLSPDPWADSSRFRPGDRFDGRVVNMIKSGAFVEIEPGVEGFIHLSRMNLVKKISKPEDLLKIGDAVSVKVISVNPGEKKLSLDLTDDGTGPWNRDAGDLEEIVEGSIERVIPQGVNVRLENGLLGFIPKKELACPPGTDLNKKYAIGATIRAAVTEFDRDSRNMILSEKKAIENSEKKEYTFYQEKHAATEKSTLGNLLKNKFEELQKNVKKDQ